MRASLSILLLLLAASAACTTTSTVGENPDTADGAGTGAPGSGGSPGAGASTPAPPTASGATPASPPDTKGIVAVYVTVEQHLGSVDPFTKEQPGLTAIHVVPRDRDVPTGTPSGTPGTCAKKLNDPSAAGDDHSIDVPITANVLAGGRQIKTEYDAKYRTSNAAFEPVLPDGTPVTITFGPEVPALAGKSITVAATTTTLASPARKPYKSIDELRGYAPGTSLDLQWSSVPGKKWIAAVEPKIQPLNRVDCYPGDTATSFSIPADMMSYVTSAANPDTQFPGVFLTSRTETVQDVGSIKVRALTESTLFFQLNMNP